MPPKPDWNNSLKVENREKSLAIPPVKAKLLEGKRGLMSGSPTKIQSPGAAPRHFMHSALNLP